MDKKQEEQEQYDVKYIAELLQYWNAYMSALIDEIYTGVAVNLGLKETEAYKLAAKHPATMQKAELWDSILSRFKNIFHYKVPKFRYKEKIYGSGKPLTPRQWRKFNNAIDNYWSEYADTVAEDVTVKAHILGKQTTAFRKKKKPYQNQSLHQVIIDQYDGKMPSALAQAYKKYDFNKSEKNALNKTYSSIAMYVKQSNNEIQEAIRQQIETGIKENKSPVEVASNLYWNVEKDENLTNKYSAETLKKNWNRIASTEMASVYEAGILAPYEAEAMESLKDQGKAIYMVRVGGQCDWCQSVRGTIARLVPSSIITDSQDETLISMGIKDPHGVKYAIWIGKSNIGLKKDQWMKAVCPAHPHNKATMQPINLEEEYYNPKTDDVEHKQKKDKFVPQQIDYAEKSREEMESNKPKKIGNDLVQFNNNIYQAVDSIQYNFKLEEWKRNSTNPIPVNRDSPSYRRLFED